MVTNPRSTISQPPDLAVVRPERVKKPKRSKKLTARIVSTLLALVVLAIVLRYLPPASRNAQAQAERTPVTEAPEELQLSSLQISLTPANEALYIDGVVTNTGHGSIIGATMQVDFLDAQGKLVSSIQKPMVGIAHGGTDLIRNEFARNPVQPNEMRFFRVAVEQIPPTWNHEVPILKVIAVKTP
jgi:hypothetical protein